MVDNLWPAILLWKRLNFSFFYFYFAVEAVIYVCQFDEMFAPRHVLTTKIVRIESVCNLTPSQA